jgi:DNA-binding MarR family transcriptional regulator
MKSAEALPAPQDCNCFALRSAARHVTQFYDQSLAPVGLRTTQFSILAKLKRTGPLTINALAEDMVMDRTTLSRNILPLDRDGLIEIGALASDRRAKELRLTTAGEKACRLQSRRGRGRKRGSRPASAPSAPRSFVQCWVQSLPAK